MLLAEMQETGETDRPAEVETQVAESGMHVPNLVMVEKEVRVEAVQVLASEGAEDWVRMVEREEKDIQLGSEKLAGRFLEKKTEGNPEGMVLQVQLWERSSSWDL